MNVAEIPKLLLPQLFDRTNGAQAPQELAVTVVSDVNKVDGPFGERHVWLKGCVSAEDVFRLNGNLAGFNSWKYVEGWEGEPQTELIYPMGVRPVVIVTVLPETLPHKVIRKIGTIFQFGHNGHTNNHHNIQK